MSRLAVHFAEVTVVIEYEGERSKRLLEFLFQHFHPAKPAEAQYAYRLQEDEQSGDLLLFAGEKLSLRASSDGDMAAAILEWAGYHLAYPSQGGLVLHAAGVSSGGRGLLIPGATRSGKSTLAAWLVHLGLDYLSDEMVFIPLGSSHFEGFARPIGLKHASQPVLQAMLKAPPEKFAGMRSSRGEIVPASSLGNGAVIEQAPIDRMIFPRYQAEGEPVIQRLSKAQAGLALMECLVNARNLPEHGFPEIVRLAQAAPAYRLAYSHFAQIEPILFDWLSLHEAG